MECPHFPDTDPELVRCSICIHGLTVVEPPKADNWWITPSTGLKVDATDLLVEGIIDGRVCPRCFTPRHPIGCVCDRADIFSDDMRDAARFLHDAPSRAVELDIRFSDEEARHVAASVFKRASRRIDWDSPDEKDDARRGLMEEFGQDPLEVKWFPVRINEPTHLPV